MTSLAQSIVTGQPSEIQYLENLLVTRRYPSHPDTAYGAARFPAQPRRPSLRPAEGQSRSCGAGVGCPAGTMEATRVPFCRGG